MERFELLNRLLLPADLMIGIPENALKKLGVYDKLQPPAYRLSKSLIAWQMRLANDFEVVGAENVPMEGGVLLAANHQSWLDAQSIQVASPRWLHFVAKKMLYDFPILRRVMNFAGALPIRRGGDKAGLESVIEALKQGKAVAMFPEGTIPGEEDVPREAVDRRTGLLRGKTGAVRAALAAGVPILPVGVSGTGRAFPPEKYPRLETLPIPGDDKITVRFGEPIHLSDPPEDGVSREFLHDETHRVMVAISKLVDFKRHLVPVDVPITKAPWDEPEDIVFDAGATPENKKPVGALILHGFTSHVHTVDGLAPYMKKRGIPFIMPILHGHGRHFRAMVDSSADQWYADAENAMKRLLEKVDQVVVIGLSMGGLLALKLAANHPGHVCGVATVAAALKFTDPLAGLSETLSDLFMFWPSPDAYLNEECAKENKNYPLFSTKAFASLYQLANDVTARLPEVKTPLLVLQHRANQVVHPKSAEIIINCAGAENKTIQWFEKSGHEMMLDQEAPQVFEAIEAFVLDRVTALVAK